LCAGILIEIDKEFLETFDLCVVSGVNDAHLDVSWNVLHDIMPGYKCGPIDAEGTLSLARINKGIFGPAYRVGVEIESVGIGSRMQRDRQRSSRHDDLSPQSQSPG